MNCQCYNHLYHFQALSTTNAHEKSDVTKIPGSDDPGAKATGAIPKKAYQNLPVHTSRLKDRLAKTSESNNKNEDKQEISAATVTEQEQKKTVVIPKDKAFQSRLDDDKAIEKKVQSVILPSNNTLRQKHQNISVTPTETPKRQPALMEYMHAFNRPRQTERFLVKSFNIEFFYLIHIIYLYNNPFSFAVSLVVTNLKPEKIQRVIK